MNFYISQKDQGKRLLKPRVVVTLHSVHTHTYIQAFLQDFFFLLLIQCRWPSPDCFRQEIEQPFLFWNRIYLTAEREKSELLIF